MDAAAASLMQSPFGSYMISNSISRSVNLTANRTSFPCFGTNFGLSMKVHNFAFRLLFLSN